MTQKYTEARKEGNRRWDAANLDRISIALPKGKKDIIKAHADGQGESVNEFISRAVDELLCQDGEKRMVADERRFRYRLKLRGYSLHKEKDRDGQPIYYLSDEFEPDRPDDNDDSRWLTFDELEDLCSQFEREDAEHFEERRRIEAERRAERRALERP